MREVPNAELLEQFTTGTDAFANLVASFAPTDWDTTGESPLGHLPARVLFGHAFWDSWLHERDIFVPLGRAPRAEPDELLTVTAFCLLFAGLQGGLIDDAGTTGAALSEPVEVRLRFDELPETALRIVYDTGVRVELDDAAGANRTRDRPSRWSSASPAAGPSPTSTRTCPRTSPPTSPAPPRSCSVRRRDIRWWSCARQGPVSGGWWGTRNA